RHRRILGMSLAGVGVLVLVFLAWVSVQCFRAYDSLQSAAGLLTNVEAQLAHPSSIDQATVATLIDQPEDESSTASSAVHDPPYRLAAHIPWMGPNLAAVAAVADTVDDVSTKVVPAASDVTGILRS